MKIAFRTDASTQIGTGHFMRCFALAEVLKKQGIDICFICRNLPLHLGDMLDIKSIQLITLISNDIDDSIDELAHATWLGVSQEQDAQETVKSLSGQVYDWIVLDHYALDVRWESIVRPNVKNIMVIDDLADRQHDCDILLDQNYYAGMQTRYNGKVPSHCQLLLGPNYALLREEFIALREKVKARSGEVKKVLVFFGGIDKDNYTLKAIEALAEVNARLQVDVVIGTQHPFKELIQNACAKHGYVCHIQTFRMGELMLEADLALGASGSASWERCCLGLPSLLVSLADNQIAIARELSSIGGCIYIGNKDEVSLKKWLTQFIFNQELNKKLAENAISIVDGLGVHRVIKEMRCHL